MKNYQPLFYDLAKPMTGEQIAEACEMAADILEGNWTTGEWFISRVDDDEERMFMCVEGALIAALWGINDNDINAGGEPYSRGLLTSCEVYNAVLDVANEQLLAEDPDQNKFDGLANWNDESGADEQRVLDILHLTAKRALGVED